MYAIRSYYADASPGLPAVAAPLVREHRLYQADWLLRFYGFAAGELLSAEQPDFDPLLDPKATWALRHLERFPVEVNRADYETLLRVPGIGVRSAQKIVRARRGGRYFSCTKTTPPAPMTMPVSRRISQPGTVRFLRRRP